MTGFLPVRSGEKIERNWQASDIARRCRGAPITFSSRDGSCGQTAPGAVADRTPCQGATG
jgi:hypothetical protein